MKLILPVKFCGFLHFCLHFQCVCVFENSGSVCNALYKCCVWCSNASFERNDIWWECNVQILRFFFFQTRPNDQNYEFEKKSKTISAKSIFIFMFLSSPGGMQSFLKIGLCGLLEGEKKLNFQYKSRIICQCHFLTQSHRSIFLINNPFLKKIFVLFNKPKTFAIRSNWKVSRPNIRKISYLELKQKGIYGVLTRDGEKSRNKSGTKKKRKKGSKSTQPSHHCIWSRIYYLDFI